MRESKFEIMSKLVRKARNGDQSAKDQLFEISKKTMLGVVESCYKKYTLESAGYCRDELFSAAYEAFEHCLKNFDESKATRFDTYLGIRCHGAVVDYMRLCSVKTRLEMNLKAEVAENIEDIQQREGRRAYVNEALRFVDWSKQTRLSFLNWQKLKLSADEIIHKEEEFRVSFLRDIIPHDCGDGGESFDSADLIDYFLNDCLPRTKELILGWINGETMREVGERMGMSESRVSQIIKKGIRQIKESKKARVFSQVFH